MDMIEHKTEERMRREEAAERLRQMADELSRHNAIPFVRDGMRYTLSVPDEVVFTFEIEVGDDKSEIEFGVEWSTATGS